MDMAAAGGEATAGESAVAAAVARWSRRLTSARARGSARRVRRSRCGTTSNTRNRSSNSRSNSRKRQARARGIGEIDVGRRPPPPTVDASADEDGATTAGGDAPPPAAAEKGDGALDLTSELDNESLRGFDVLFASCTTSVQSEVHSSFELVYLFVF
jgi:hypothetical protein